MPDDLLHRAHRAVDDKVARGVYAPELIEALAQPLDVKPDPAVAAGPAWAEAVRTATVTIGPPPSSSRFAVGPALTAVKRAIERALRWYLPPVLGQVTRHNQAVVDVLAEHNRQIVELRGELDVLKRRLAALEAERRSASR